MDQPQQAALEGPGGDTDLRPSLPLRRLRHAPHPPIGSHLIVSVQTLRSGEVNCAASVFQSSFMFLKVWQSEMILVSMFCPEIEAMRLLMRSVLSRNDVERRELSSTFQMRQKIFQKD
jgi:hypothetical protein